MKKTEIAFEWPRVLVKSENYSNLVPIVRFVQLLIHCDKEEMADTLEFLKSIEQALLNRGDVSFEVKHYEDIDRIDPMFLSGRIQWYIWSLMSRMNC